MKEIIRKSGCVRLWMAGHDHGGNYHVESLGDKNIIHHLTLPAPIECEEEVLHTGMWRYILID